jgi:adenylylsulfate kinase
MSTRDHAREIIHDFVEVYVRCPLEVCMSRDSEGFHAKALRGEIRDMTGLQDPNESPVNPEIVVDTDRESPRVCEQAILAEIAELGHISRLYHEA